MEFIFSEINIYMYRQIFLGLRCFKYFTEYEHFSVFCSIVFNGINSLYGFRYRNLFSKFYFQLPVMNKGQHMNNPFERNV